MNVSASSIRSALSTQLSAVTEIKQVVFGRTEVLSSFPACRVYLLGVGEKTETTAENYRTYTYSIEVVYPFAIPSLAKATSEAEFEDAIDAVMDKLGTQWNMAGLEASVVDQAIVRYSDDVKGPQGVCQITWSAKTLITI